MTSAQNLSFCPLNIQAPEAPRIPSSSLHQRCPRGRPLWGGWGTLSYRCGPKSPPAPFATRQAPDHPGRLNCGTALRRPGSGARGASWRRRWGRGASRALGPARRAPRPQPEGPASPSRARVLGSGPRRRRWREGFVAVEGTGSWGTVPFRAATVGKPPSALPVDADQRGASGDVRCSAVWCLWHAWLCGSVAPGCAVGRAPQRPRGRASAGSAAGERSPGR